jgi:hypothetical protein
VLTSDAKRSVMTIATVPASVRMGSPPQYEKEMTAPDIS